MREADVTEAVRQKNWATQQMNRRNVPQLSPMAETQLVGMMYRSMVGSAGSAEPALEMEQTWVDDFGGL